MSSSENPSLTVIIFMHGVMGGPSPLEKFPHPYVAHPKPDHGPHHDHPHGPEHAPLHGHGPALDHPPPDPHHGEQKLPKKCHTEYVSVISKVFVGCQKIKIFLNEVKSVY